MIASMVHAVLRKNPFRLSVWMIASMVHAVLRKNPFVLRRGSSMMAPGCSVAVFRRQGRAGSTPDARAFFLALAFRTLALCGSFDAGDLGDLGDLWATFSPVSAGFASGEPPRPSASAAGVAFAASAA